MPQPREAVVITASDRISAGIGEDRSGALLTAWLQESGYDVWRELVADGEPVREAVARAIKEQRPLILVTGGTGITPRDQTPEMVASLLDVEIPGIMEQIRAVGTAKGVHGAALTRGVAGLAGRGPRRSVVVTLPGSPGGVKDSIGVLSPLLDHLLEQVVGADH